VKYNVPFISLLQVSLHASLISLLFDILLPVLLVNPRPSGQLGVSGIEMVIRAQAGTRPMSCLKQRRHVRVVPTRTE